MRLLYVSKAMVVSAYRDKLRALAKDVSVCTVIPSRWGNGRVPGSTNVLEVRELDTWFHGHNHLHLYRGIGEVIRDVRPDLVHIDEEPFSAVTAQVAHASARAGVPTLFFSWQNLEKRLPPPFGVLRSYVFRKVGGAIAGTDAAASVLRRSGYLGPLAIVPQMGVDVARFAPNKCARAQTRKHLRIADDAIVVGFGGRLVMEKGVDLLIEAIAAIPDIHLVLVGDGPDRAMFEGQVDRLGLRQRVVFAGRVESTEMPRWLNAFDVLVLPSRSTRSWTEQFGRILVEAMACGVAVAGARSGEIARVIGDAGVTFREDDAAALADVLRGLCADEQLRTELGQRGRAHVERLFTNQRIARETIAFYHEVLG